MAKHNVFDKYDVQKQKDLLVQILTTEPPYKSFDFEYDWYIYFGLIENLCIDAYCEKCCGEKVFDGERYLIEVDVNHKRKKFKIQNKFPDNWDEFLCVKDVILAFNKE